MSSRWTLLLSFACKSTKKNPTRATDFKAAVKSLCATRLIRQDRDTETALQQNKGARLKQSAALSTQLHLLPAEAFFPQRGGGGTGYCSALCPDKTTEEDLIAFFVCYSKITVSAQPFSQFDMQKGIKLPKHPDQFH